MRKGMARVALALAAAFTLWGCGADEAPTPDTQSDDTSVDEQMSPASENRPAGMGRDDTTATPGTQPDPGQRSADQTEARDRLPPDE